MRLLARAHTQKRTIWEETDLGVVGFFVFDAERSGTLACAPRLRLRCSLALTPQKRTIWEETDLGVVGFFCF